MGAVLIAGKGMRSPVAGAKITLSSVGEGAALLVSHTDCGWVGGVHLSTDRLKKHNIILVKILTIFCSIL